MPRAKASTFRAPAADLLDVELLYSEDQWKLIFSFLRAKGSHQGIVRNQVLNTATFLRLALHERSSPTDSEKGKALKPIISAATDLLAGLSQLDDATKADFAEAALAWHDPSDIFGTEGYKAHIANIRPGSSPMDGIAAAAFTSAMVSERLRKAEAVVKAVLTWAQSATPAERSLGGRPSKEAERDAEAYLCGVWETWKVRAAPASDAARFARACLDPVTRLYPKKTRN